jgi:hypothetical protein
MYFKEPSKGLAFANSKTGLAAIIISSLLVIILGIFPGTILMLISSFI